MIARWIKNETWHRRVLNRLPLNSEKQQLKYGWGIPRLIYDCIMVIAGSCFSSLWSSEVTLIRTDVNAGRTEMHHKFRVNQVPLKSQKCLCSIVHCTSVFLSEQKKKCLFAWSVGNSHWVFHTNLMTSGLFNKSKIRASKHFWNVLYCMQHQ